MKTLGNIIWMIFGGIEWAICLFFAGIIYCCTIIYIPVGLQLFKMAKFVIWPFGKSVVKENVTGFKKFINFFWAIFGGLELALCFCICGLLYCVTIIGIPFGRQYFKLAKFIIAPLGKNFGKAEVEAPAEPAAE